MATPKKLLALKQDQNRVSEVEAASKIIFDDDKNLGIQSAALQSYLISLEAHSVKLEANAPTNIDC